MNVSRNWGLSSVLQKAGIQSQSGIIPECGLYFDSGVKTSSDQGIHSVSRILFES